MTAGPGDGRVVVVTGGGTGIGRAIALRFAAGGDRVFVTGRRREPLEETARAAAGSTAPARITAHVCDGTQPDQLRALAAALPEQVDVLVNNAGGNTDFAGPEPAGLESLADQWRANFEANVVTAVLTTELLADRLATGGRVISFGSIAADKPSGSYGAAKAALAAWNLSAAARLGPRGITANVVAPGYIGETEFFHGTLTDERRATLIGSTATKRAGVPGDIAETVWFLASPGARHITGQVVQVNGGAQPTR